MSCAMPSTSTRGIPAKAVRRSARSWASDRTRRCSSRSAGSSRRRVPAMSSRRSRACTPRFPDAQLLIVGTDITPGGWFSAALRRRTAELDLERHVRFLGRRQDIEGLLAAADVFVMPSFEEPFGLVFCEAMAMERPVVALDEWRYIGGRRARSHRLAVRTGRHRRRDRQPDRPPRRSEAASDDGCGGSSGRP